MDIIKIELLLEKVISKNECKESSQKRFSELHPVLVRVVDSLKGIEASKDIKVELIVKSTNCYELVIGSETIVFALLPDVYSLDKDHILSKHSYIEKHKDKAFFGVINVYNFLTSSLQMQREEDLGYLVARIMFNSEGYFNVEGKRQLASQFNFGVDKLEGDNLSIILQSLLEYCLEEFDLLLPQYEDVKVTSAEQILKFEGMYLGKVGKRVGYRFNTDDV